MFKSFILFVMILKIAESGFSREPSFLQCKMEEERFNWCLEDTHNQFPGNPDNTLLLEKALDCIGPLRCNGVLKYQKFLIENELFSRKLKDILKCATVDSVRQAYASCWLLTKDDCDQMLSATPGCEEDKKAIKTYIKVRRFNENRFQKALREESNRFDVEFDEAGGL
ncbi:hypothetical protein CAEBREN_05200 [Caenorhabditis brenneri]|uniref:DUF19 domain-containing protein n=1 Tax=Caenorhabditis brenneri TaxID=135651 RepID=G0M9N4_CAEBE|nr:hypothetical protein CAEBREN_05200 [Caenorhabditis brenneri]